MGQEPRIGVGKIIGSCIFLGFVLTVIYFCFVHSYYARLTQGRVGDFFASFTSPAEVQTALYLVTPQNGGASYARGSLDYSEYEQRRITSDLAYEQGMLASIAYNSQKELPYQVVVEGRVIKESAVPLRSVALAPSGNFVTFSRLVEGDVSPYFAQNWEAVLLDTRSGAERVLGSAFASFFLNNETIIRFSHNEVVVESLAGVRISSSKQNFLAASSPVAYSYDRSHVAFAEDSSIRIFAVDSENAFSLSEKINFPIEAGSITSLALSNTSLYVVTTNQKTGTSITHYALEGGAPEVVRKFPPMLAVAKMIL